MGSGSLLAILQAAVRVPSFRKSTSSTFSPPIGLGTTAAEDEALRRFHRQLGGLVEQLQLQGGNAHLHWLMDAFASTLSAHSSLRAALAIHHSPAPSNYADDVLSMLDVCPSLRQAADDAGRQLSHLQTALLRASSSIDRRSDRLATARRLRTCLDGLQGISSAEYSPIAEAQACLRLAVKRKAAAITHVPHALPLALEGTLLLSLLALASATATFAPPIRSTTVATRRVCKLTAGHASLFLNMKSKGSTSASAVDWATPLFQLQRDLREEEMSALFKELQGIQAAVASFHDAIATANACTTDEGLRKNMDELWKRVKEAQAFVSELRVRFESLFQALVALRLALMGQP